jgi:hypothetical protein
MSQEDKEVRHFFRGNVFVSNPSVGMFGRGGAAAKQEGGIPPVMTKSIPDTMTSFWPERIVNLSSAAAGYYNFPGKRLQIEFFSISIVRAGSILSGSFPCAMQLPLESSLV